MEHLSAEELARLVDDVPADDEARHLEACEACREILGELREQTEALGGLPAMRPPRGDWEVLQARLVSEGLVRGGSRLGLQLARTPGWMKVAAAVVLFLSGAFVGGMAVRGPGPILSAGGAPADAAFRPAGVEAGSVEEAARLVRLTERRYMDALVQYQQMVVAEGGESAIPDAEERFAALEYITRAGQAALREAPTDPFLNGLVASAVAEREAVLRSISTSPGENWF